MRKTTALRAIVPNPCRACGRTAQHGEHYCSAACERTWLVERYTIYPTFGPQVGSA